MKTKYRILKNRTITVKELKQKGFELLDSRIDKSLPVFIVYHFCNGSFYMSFIYPKDDYGSWDNYMYPYEYDNNTQSWSQCHTMVILKNGNSDLKGVELFPINSTMF